MLWNFVWYTHKPLISTLVCRIAQSDRNKTENDFLRDMKWDYRNLRLRIKMSAKTGFYGEKNVGIDWTLEEKLSCPTGFPPPLKRLFISSLYTSPSKISFSIRSQFSKSSSFFLSCALLFLLSPFLFSLSFSPHDSLSIPHCSLFALCLSHSTTVRTSLRSFLPSRDFFTLVFRQSCFLARGQFQWPPT